MKLESIDIRLLSYTQTDSECLWFFDEPYQDEIFLGYDTVYNSWSMCQYVYNEYIKRCVIDYNRPFRYFVLTVIVCNETIILPYIHSGESHPSLREMMLYVSSRYCNEISIDSIVFNELSLDDFICYYEINKLK